MYSLIIELLKNFEKNISISWAYNYCIQLAYLMVSFEKVVETSGNRIRKKSFANHVT